MQQRSRATRRKSVGNQVIFPIGYNHQEPDFVGANWETVDRIMKENWEGLVAADKAAKAAGSLVGRYLTHPYADGQAVYQITKATTRTATIRVVTGLGDDWVLPAWGTQATLTRGQVERFIQQREGLAKLFGGTE